MRWPVVLACALALAAALVRWRGPARHASEPQPPASAGPVALPAPREAAHAPTRPPVEEHVRIDPSDPALRAAVEKLGDAVAPDVEAIAVTTVDEAMEAYRRAPDLIDLQTRLDRILFAKAAEGRKLHACFLGASDEKLLFVLAKVAAERVEGDDLAPWVETARSGAAPHRAMAMYALAGDRGRPSLDALVAGWSDPAAREARATAGFVLESRVDEMEASEREGVRRACREAMSGAGDPAFRAEAVTLLGSPHLAAEDIAAVIALLAAPGDEGVRLAALRALATGGAAGEAVCVAALDRVIAEPGTPDRLREAARAVRQAPAHR